MREEVVRRSGRMIPAAFEGQMGEGWGGSWTEMGIAEKFVWGERKGIRSLPWKGKEKERGEPGSFGKGPRRISSTWRPAGKKGRRRRQQGRERGDRSSTARRRDRHRSLTFEGFTKEKEATVPFCRGGKDSPARAAGGKACKKPPPSHITWERGFAQERKKSWSSKRRKKKGGNRAF